VGVIDDVRGYALGGLVWLTLLLQLLQAAYGGGSVGLLSSCQVGGVPL